MPTLSHAHDRAGCCSRLTGAALALAPTQQIVLICIRCYSLLEPAYTSHRAAAFDAYGIPRDTNRFEKLDACALRCRSAAVALTSHSSRLPAERRAHLEQVVATELGVDASELTIEMLRHAAQDLKRSPRENFRSPEERLLEVLGAVGGETALHEFVLGWRNLFVQTLSPSHLPSGWSLDHRRAPEWAHQ